MDLLNLVDLNEIERQTYEELYNRYKSQQLEVRDIKESIVRMKNAVTHELVKTSVEDKEKIIKLQARIENLMGLEVILEAPEIAEKQYQAAIQNLKRQKERNQQ